MFKHGAPEKEKKLYGNYRAEVVSTNDISGGRPVKAGRVKVRVFGIHDHIDDDYLPWAIYADPFMGGGKDSGGMFVPDEGDLVWVFFEQGEKEQPVYFAGAPSRLDGPSEKSKDYPHRKVFKTKAGYAFEISDQEGNTELKITQPNGNQKTVNHEGDEENIVNGNLVINVESGKVVINSDDIRLGDDTDLESGVLGEQLAAWIANVLKPWLDSHQHIGNMGSPTSASISPFNVGAAQSGGGVYSSKVKIQP